VNADIACTFREESGRAVATLIRIFGDIDLAEDAVQEAFTIAIDKWPVNGWPPNPGAWIVTTARNRAIDRLRREASRHERHVQATVLHPGAPPAVEVGPVTDDRLRLIFTCCHPALAPGSQVALTLRRSRRSADRRDRSRLPRPRGDDGAAPGAVQEEDQRRQHPLSGPG
jgi:RNA polymerase sigma-70 factor, ECF subfamily